MNFLIEHREAVIRVNLVEYNEQEGILLDGIEQGMELGREQGIEQGVAALADKRPQCMACKARENR